MAEYCEEAVKGAFVSMSNCHNCLKEGIKTVNLKEFRIVVSAGPEIEIDIKTRDPCDALAISGALVKTLRMMDKEPKAKVMS
jgi:hypothetical protein